MDATTATRMPGRERVDSSRGRGVHPKRGVVSLVGSTLDKFELLEVVGRGGFGEVYRARDRTLRREVAIKVLPAKFADDETAVERFLREARAASRLNHPNICTIYEIDRVEGTSFIVMELLAGKSLFDYIDSSPVGLDDFFHLAGQISRGLAAAHAVGLAHRDIKSTNIMVEADDTAKILDFGLARFAQSETSDGSTQLTQDGSVFGTIGYMAPELLLGKEADSRVDIFSFGVLCFEMLTGSLPYKGKSVYETANQILTQTNQAVSRLREVAPDELTNLIAGMLERDPEDRVQSMQTVADVLSRLGEQRRLVETSAYAALSETAVSPAVVGPTLAVLPFSNLSPDPENEFFADGLTEELIGVLSRIDGLNVVARTSVYAFKNHTGDVRDLGRELKVDHVLEGSVRRFGDRLRISTQLVNTRTGFQVWAGVFDRKIEDIFTLQDEIARTIARQLKVELVGRDEKLVKARTDDVEAYNSYLKGRYFWNRRYEAGMKRGIEFFKHALELDRDYPLPYAGLADSYNMLAFYNFIDPEEGFPAAEKAARTALKLDPSLAEAEAALGWTASFFHRDWKQGAKHFQRAIELDADYGNAYFWYSFLLVIQGRLRESLEQVKKARALDPLSAIVIAGTSFLLYYHHQFDQAIKEIDAGLDLDPSFPVADLFYAWNYYGKGDYDKAIEHGHKAIETIPISLTYAMLGCAMAKAGDMDDAGALAERIEQMEGYISPYYQAALQFHLGHERRGLELLEESWEHRNNHLCFIAVDPLFDAYHDTDWFRDLTKRLNLAETDTRVQRESGVVFGD